MSLLSAVDLAMLQTQSANLVMPETCLVQAPTPTADGQGGQTLAWSTVATTVCHVATARPTSGSEQMTPAGRVMQQERYIVALPGTTTVQQTYRLVITTQNNRVFQVETVQNQSWPIMQRCICEEIL